MIADKLLKIGYNETINIEQKVVSLPLKPDLQPDKPPTINKVIQKEESNVDIENINLYFGITALVFVFCYVFLKK